MECHKPDPRFGVKDFKKNIPKSGKHGTFRIRRCHRFCHNDNAIACIGIICRDDGRVAVIFATMLAITLVIARQDINMTLVRKMQYKRENPLYFLCRYRSYFFRQTTTRLLLSLFSMGIFSNMSFMAIITFPNKLYIYLTKMEIC